MAFISGMCALSYQVYWIRELRLVLGATTPATATVLAVFMGGIGLGSLFLGPRADRSRNPFRFYAVLELVVTIGALLSPLLLMFAWAIHGSLFTEDSVGTLAAALVRTTLAMLVLLVPAVAMGGTLPILGRAIEEESDPGRGRWSLLYGFNTLGAIVGAALPTLFLFEHIGARRTVLAACAVNALLTAFAFRFSRGAGADEGETAQALESGSGEAYGGNLRLACLAAFLAGFAFFLAELAWYRMLAPILGGTTYTFGLILMVVLLGIGVGGGVYSFWSRGRCATAGALALVSSLAALTMAVPLAAGDGVALAAALLGNARAFGFLASTAGWLTIISFVVLPAAVLAGIQFPMILAIAGRGRRQIGTHAGLVTAFNTAGAVLGSLLGSFLLVPKLGAPACWRLAGAVCLVVATVACVSGWKLGGKARTAPLAIGLMALLCLSAAGPSAVWRHSGIGVGAFPAGNPDARAVERWLRFSRAAILRDVDGREASMAIIARDGLAFDMNGKIDGNAIGDAPTQVMLGLLGSLFHRNEPRTALVIGLGTGSTAGWLAGVESIERVDVAEIEPVVAEFSKMCAPVNRDAMDNPKIRVHVADGREFVEIAREKYDIIASEPSNPYRAGIASLYTRDFYLSAARRMNKGGIFVQWLQTYDIDADTFWTIMVTLRSAFRHVEVWQTTLGDVALVASDSVPLRDAARLRARIGSSPYREALSAAWLAEGLEGVLGHHVAGPALAGQLAREGRWQPDTADRNRIEYGFARSLLVTRLPIVPGLIQVARMAGAGNPDISGPVDWGLVEENMGDALSLGSVPQAGLVEDRERAARQSAMSRYLIQSDLPGCLSALRSLNRPPRTVIQRIVLADCLADEGNEAAIPLIEQLSADHPVEARLIRARLLLRRGKTDEASKALSGAFETLRERPWAFSPLVAAGLDKLVPEISRDSPRRAQEIANALSMPFSTYRQNVKRLATIIRTTPEPAQAVGAMAAFEPDFPWEEDLLAIREQSYEVLSHPLAAQARTDSLRYQAQERGNIVQSFIGSTSPPR
ncbi:MAG TPA: fused MFS/spermidine synthase [Candidatus Deferrimicrobiaceae bacterium]